VFAFVSFQVKVGKNVNIPAHSKVSLLPQPSNEDSDEELEYTDTRSGVTDSPCESARPECLFVLVV
jgi:translation initiation factor eIF-2B subunit epsilon